MQDEYYQPQPNFFQTREGRIGLVIGLIVGLLIGWFVLGWWIAPVQWVNASPGDLHPRWQQHYVAMVVDSYLLTRDPEIARARLADFDPTVLSQLFGEVQAEFEARGGTLQAEGVQELAQALGIPIVPPGQPVAQEGAPAGEKASAPAGSGVLSPTMSRVVQVCGIVLVAFLLVFAAIGGFLWLRGRSMEFEGVGESETAGGSGKRGGRLPIHSINVGEPVTLQYLDDGPDYEEMVQIYQDGEIVGSCGLRGVSTLSEDGKVVACSAWLYEPMRPELSPDTRIIASRRVYENEALRNTLLLGRDHEEIILAEPNQSAYLEHATLGLLLRVVDVEYADPEQKFISMLVVEMEPVLKEQEPEEPEPDIYA